MSRFADLRNKEIVNITDGKRLGYVCDVDFDLEAGTVASLIIPKKIAFWNIFKKNDEYVIPLEMIRKIGDDIIIVEYVCNL